eukprot:UN02134
MGFLQHTVDQDSTLGSVTDAMVHKLGEYLKYATNVRNQATKGAHGSLMTGPSLAPTIMVTRPLTMNDRALAVNESIKNTASGIADGVEQGFSRAADGLKEGVQKFDSWWKKMWGKDDEDVGGRRYMKIESCDDIYGNNYDGLDKFPCNFWNAMVDVRP